MGNTIKNEYRPETVTPPGGTIQDILDERSMTQVELAERMGRSKEFINRLIHGRDALSQDVALELERVLNVPARFWNQREQQYREAEARQEEHYRLERFVDWMKQTFPISDMKKRGWLPDCDNEVAQVDAVLDYFGVASPAEWQSVWMNPETKAAFRKTLAFASEPGAVSAWLRYGELEARKIDAAPYEKSSFKQALQEIRSLTVESPEIFQSEMRALCKYAGVALVLTPQVEGARISGATRWIAPDRALIQMSLRYKTNDHFWFTFFHEAGHLLLHGKREIFLEGSQDEMPPEKEKEANAFAARTLIPQKEYQAFVRAGAFDRESLQAFADALGIAPGIVVGRLQHEKVIPWKSRLNKLKQSFTWEFAGAP
jgi:plasmid maintenance system antidote protein VapI